MRPMTDGSRSARFTLVVDLAMLPLFVLVGLRTHSLAGEAETFLRNAVPVTVAWLLVAVVLRTYRPPSFSRFIVNWLIAVPVGLLIRTWIAGTLGNDGVAVFFGVAMVFTLAFLAFGRLISGVLGPRLFGAA